MTLSRYDAQSDIYEQYHIVGDTVAYHKRYLNAQDSTPFFSWTHRLDELGWIDVDAYIKHLKARNYKEVKPDATVGSLTAAII